MPNTSVNPSAMSAYWALNIAPMTSAKRKVSIGELRLLIYCGRHLYQGFDLTVMYEAHTERQREFLIDSEEALPDPKAFADIRVLDVQRTELFGYRLAVLSALRLFHCLEDESGSCAPEIEERMLGRVLAGQLLVRVAHFQRFLVDDDRLEVVIDAQCLIAAHHPRDLFRSWPAKFADRPTESCYAELLGEGSRLNSGARDQIDGIGFTGKDPRY